MVHIILPNINWGMENDEDLRMINPLTILSMDPDEQGDIIRAIQEQNDVRNSVRACLAEAGFTFSTDPSNKRNYYVVEGSTPKQIIDSELRSTVTGLNMPDTFSYEEYAKAPFYPVVVKHSSAARGMWKFKIETKEQLRIFQNFLVAKQATNEDHLFANDSFVYQEFIDCPGDRYTSYRVLVTAKGTVLASGLFYSSSAKNTDPVSPSSDDPFAALSDPQSEFYLHSSPFQSNLSQGGNVIVLDPLARSKSLAKGEDDILRSHGLNPDTPSLPDPMRKLASQIGMTVGKKLDLVIGIDFIQSGKADDPHYHYLETNSGPDAMLYLLTHYSRHCRTIVDAHVHMVKAAISELLDESDDEQ